MDPVCIIGAGPGGLSAAVALQRRGIPFRILDAGRRPGGIWDMEREDTPMYASAHFISSKTLSGFPDFPMPESYPDYPRHDQIQGYIEAYAAHHGLERHATFGATVVSARPVVRRADHRGDGEDPPDPTSPGEASSPESWEVRWRLADGTGETGTFSALVVATGVTWHPSIPEIPGDFAGELRHSQSYRDPDEFRGKRVLIVGGGNSGVDIACDAARAADRAFLSLRRGYHFVPKYVFGTPSDVFAHSGPQLPAWLEGRVFGFLMDKVLVGDLTRYGLPEPDHPILSSHPIMNTQVLHYLGHGDLTPKPDLERFDGEEAVFVDGSREAVDLVLLATGYRRRFPFLELPENGAAAGEATLGAAEEETALGAAAGEATLGAAAEETALGAETAPAGSTHRPEPTRREVRPEDLFLMLFHRRHPTLSLLGIFETDGAAYELFARQAELVARSVEQLREAGAGRERLRAHIHRADPDLRGGRRYVASPRHDYYVTDRRYRKELARFQRMLERAGASP